MNEWFIQKRTSSSSSTYEISQQSGASNCGAFAMQTMISPYNFRGKTGEIVSGNGLGYDVIFRLMAYYLDQGYSLYVDNFCTSPTLAIDLFAHKTHITGTLD